MIPPPASGRASALRVNIAATSTPIFKTRITPCRIAVRAEIKKSIHCNKNRCRIAVCWTSRGIDQRRNMPLSRPILRFNDDCRLKTADSQHHCGLRFPNGTGRCNSTRLLEQMPRSGDRRASARRALIATSLLRTSLIVTPRQSSAPAKSKPYVFAVVSLLTDVDEHSAMNQCSLCRTDCAGPPFLAKAQRLQNSPSRGLPMEEKYYHSLEESEL